MVNKEHFEITHASELIHFLKHSKSAFVNEITKIMKDSPSWCPFNHNKKEKKFKMTDPICFVTHEGLKHTKELLSRYEKVFQLLEIDPIANEGLRKLIETIGDPTYNLSLMEFQANLRAIVDFSKIYEEDIFEKAKNFTCNESLRLGEAISCFEIGAYYASTILSVTAVEARIHTLIRLRNKKLYEKFFAKLTLGQAIGLMKPLNNNEKSSKNLTKIIPKKHLPLMDILNEYRIFSAHPKDEKVGYNIANSIINLSFHFLIDPDLRIPEKFLQNGRAPAN